MNSFHSILNKVLKALKSDIVSLHGEAFRCLFLLSFDDLKAAELGNPLIHPLIVLKHTIEIGLDENCNILHLGAIAILHDIAPIEKIRKNDLLKEDSEESTRSLDEERKQHRIIHMREGSALARRKLLLLNEYLGKAIYADKDIDIVCDVISIHDNPSIDIPIYNENRLASIFREADRLWMLSREGFNCDLQRDEKRTGNKSNREELSSKRLHHIITRFKEERRLYSSVDGPFIDDELFFRTKSGYGIFLRYLRELRNLYGIQ